MGRLDQLWQHWFKTGQSSSATVVLFSASSQTFGFTLGQLHRHCHANKDMKQSLSTEGTAAGVALLSRLTLQPYTQHSGKTVLTGCPILFFENLTAMLKIIVQATKKIKNEEKNDKAPSAFSIRDKHVCHVDSAHEQMPIE